VHALVSGQNPAMMAASFLKSEEYAKHLTREHYEKFLQHKATADGWQQ
jgi:hypothetical protein